MYSLDFKKLAVTFLPSVFRKPRLIAWVKILVGQLQGLNTGFLDFRNTIMEELSYNSQVMVLQNALNRTFNGSRHDIKVLDPESTLVHSYTYFKAERASPVAYTRFASEHKGKFMFGLFFIEYARPDFIVLVPSDIGYSTDEKKALISEFVNRYKLADKKFEVINAG